MDISDLKVTIKDKDILMSIEPDMLKSYLERNEWDMSEDYIMRDGEIIGNIYTKYNNDLHRHVHVKHLFSTEWTDYASRMAENLFEMETLGISQLKLYCEITGNTVLIMPESDLAEIDEMIKGIVSNVVS
jgi:hypothetical protein